MQNSYDAFISYRRAEASALASWIRNRLQRYRLPAEVLETLSSEKRELHQRGPRIYVDRVYEKPAEDFLLDKIYPALDASQRLIVLSTPSVFDTIKDASGVEAPNWLVREIDRFMGPDSTTEHRPVDVVLGPLAPEDRFPGRLSGNQRWDWIDLRAFTWWRSWGLSEALDAGFTKLAAGIYDIPDAALPLMRQEERRRRRNIIAAAAGALLVVSVVIGVLALGWWNAKQATRITDVERRFDVALRLVDSGAIPGAVDGFARLSGDGLQRTEEAKRLLAAWAARLNTASGQVAKLPDRSVFRWRGRNYVKTEGKIAGSYDGPPPLVSGVVSDNSRIVTFDADRVIRVRGLSALDKPEMETPTLPTTSGSISELFGGRLLVFEGSGLALGGGDDDANDQVVFGRFFALLAPGDGRYATIELNSDDAPSPEISCGSIKFQSGDVTPSWQKQSDPDATLRGTIAVNAASTGPLNWRFESNEASISGAPEAPGTVGAACAPQVLAARPVTALSPRIAQLSFPATIEEKLLWKEIGSEQKSSDASVCIIDENGKDKVDGSCYAGSGAVSIDPGHVDSLASIMRNTPIPDARTLAGPAQRLVVQSATGSQSADVAFCDVASGRMVSRCLVLHETARSSLTYLAGNEFAAINSEEVNPQSFQLVDLRNLRVVSIYPSPGEKLADVTMSTDTERLAVLTQAGEVWMYGVDRDKASGQINQRFDFRQSMDSMEPKPPATPDRQEALEPISDATFSIASFVDNRRLLLAGAKGGIVMAEAPSGTVIWTRPPLSLYGTVPLHVASNAASDVAAVYDDASAQLISLSSGALLSRVVDFASLTVSDPQKDDSVAGTSVDISADGSVTINFRGHSFRPSGSWVKGIPDRRKVADLTGVGTKGETGPLDIFLQP